MRVTVIASTEIKNIPASVIDTEFGDDMLDTRYGGLYSEIDMLSEFAGRSCYQSWKKPNPETATNTGYMKNIISQGHFSVLEHGSVTFYVEGVSRALTHELIRHRHLSYSELSQRFVNIEDAEIVTPPALSDGSSDHRLASVEDEAKYQYMKIVDALVSDGVNRKQAREAARAVMPSMIETKIVVTGNLRAWRDVLQKRHSVHADAEIQQFAAEVLKHLREIAPASVQDIPDEPYN